MPRVEVVSVSAESFCGVFRSTISPSAIRGATAPPGPTVRGVAVLAGGTKAGAWATLRAGLRGWPEDLLSAAYAAPAAPATSSASAASTAAPGRQRGAPPSRLAVAALPHCRHQSCAGASGAPQFAHGRV